MASKPEKKPGKKKAVKKGTVKKTLDKPTSQPETGPWTPDNKANAANKPDIKTVSPKKDDRTTGPLWFLALLAIVIGGGYATQPLWQPYIPDLTKTTALSPAQKAAIKNSGAIKDLEQERRVLEDKLGALINRLGSLEQQLVGVRRMVEATALPGEVAATTESLQRLSGRLMKVEQGNETTGQVLDRLKRLEQEITQATRTASKAPPEMTAAISAISKRLESLETGDQDRQLQSARQSDARALVLAVGQLRQALRSGAPYALALETLKRLGSGSRKIANATAGLQAHAKTGEPTLATLIREYSAVTATIRTAKPAATGSFFDQTLERLKLLVKIRRVDENGASPDTAADKATQALRNGGLQAAIDLLEGLDEPSAEARDWIRRARSRLAAEQALATLNVYAVSLLTPATQ